MKLLNSKGVTLLEHLLAFSLTCGMIVSFFPINHAIQQSLFIEKKFLSMNRILEEEVERFVREGSYKEYRIDGETSYTISISTTSNREIQKACVQSGELSNCLEPERIYAP